jgi:hypothetical protein
MRALLVALMALVPPTRPYIRSRLGGIHTIENPLKVRVRVTLDCGPEWAVPPVPVPARNSTTVYVHDDDGNSPSSCTVGEWRKGG